MNSLSVKSKFQIGQFKSLKQIFCKFQGQLDLEGQGPCHKFLKYARHLDDQYTVLKAKFITVQKLLHLQGITQNFQVSRPI